MNKRLEGVLLMMPPEIYKSVKNIENIQEIRLRRNRRLSVVADGRNILCNILIDDNMIKKSLNAFCKGSLYCHMDTIKEGFIALDDGFRIGVCGSAVVSGDGMKGVVDISSVSIRVPNDFPDISLPIYKRLSACGFYKSLLIYSPPGVGKTTVLRDIIVKLGNVAGKRVAVIDTRKEIATERIEKTENVDIFSGYPKAQGIFIATRTMNPEFIVCDEIGGYEESLALLSAQNTGVPIIATAHASSVDELLRRKNIAILHESHLFDAYVGIKRSREDYGRNRYEWFDRSEKESTVCLKV